MFPSLDKNCTGRIWVIILEPWNLLKAVTSTGKLDDKLWPILVLSSVVNTHPCLVKNLCRQLYACSQDNRVCWSQDEQNELCPPSTRNLYSDYWLLLLFKEMQKREVTVIVTEFPLYLRASTLFLPPLTPLFSLFISFWEPDILKTRTFKRNCLYKEN